MFVYVYGWADVLMLWIIAVRAGCGDFDLGLWFCLHLTTGLKNYREALPSRRRNAFSGTFVFDRLMGARTLGTEVVHGGEGVDGWKNVVDAV